MKQMHKNVSEATKIDAQMFGSNGNEYNNCFKAKVKILTT